MVIVQLSFVQLEMNGEGKRGREGGEGVVVSIGQSVHAPNPMSALNLDTVLI